MNRAVLLAGTVPADAPDLAVGIASLKGDALHIDGRNFPLSRGTAAMVGAVCAAAEVFGNPAPTAVIGGDNGSRNGSRLVYRHLIKTLPRSSAEVLGLHYIVPDIALHNQMTAAARKAHPRPMMIADAGFMYAAKAAGQAALYDLFFPDLGELAFLADEKALHPAYTRGFLTSLENDPAALIARAVASRNVPEWVCVKGARDVICHNGQVSDCVNSPVVEALEAIGGTGDTIFGMTAALVSAGLPIPEACRVACQANREAGRLAGVSPADQIPAIIEKIPAALELVLQAEPAGPERRSRAME